MTAITPEVLLKAYAAGVFPMAETADDDALYWIDPETRGVLPFDNFHVPKRLKRTVRSGKFSIRIDHAFDAVIAACAKASSERQTTWINERICRLYSTLHELGHCHTVEAWLDGELAGGLYGVRLGAAFFGESMFSRDRDASKVALVHLAARLKAGGFTLFDTQFITDHLVQFGAVEISREEYHRRLKSALGAQADFYRFRLDGDGETVLHSVSQRS